MKNIRKLLYLLPFAALTGCGAFSTDEGYKFTPPIIEPEGPDTFYKGMTMGFTDILMKHGGIIYREDGQEKDPYQSLKDHGGNMVRLAVNVDNTNAPASVGGFVIDTEDWNIVKGQMEHCKEVGLEVMLTFHLASNNGDAMPLSWKAMAPTQDELGELIYDFVYEKLDWLGENDMLPPIVGVGNETNWTFCWDKDLYGNGNDTGGTAHGAKMLNKGWDAVDAINVKYGTKILKLLHSHNPIDLPWTIEEFKKNGATNFDIMGMSFYYSGEGCMGQFASFEELAKWIKTNYGKYFMIVEASCHWTSKNGDNCNNIGPIPTPGYEVSPAGMKKWYEDFATDVAKGGGLGIISWGAEWVGNNTAVYWDFTGSSWDDKTYWTSEYGSDYHNLHEGIDWMLKTYK